MDAYRLVKAGRSAAKLTYTLGKNGQIATGLATDMVKAGMVREGTFQLTKTTAFAATFQVGKRIIRNSKNNERCK